MSTPVTICSHVVYVKDKDVFGPGHVLHNYLGLKNIDHVYIKHSLYNSRPTIIEEYKGNRILKSKSPISALLPGHLRYPLEWFVTLKYLIAGNRTKVFIAIDPINAFAGIIAKKLGRVDTLVFYTADYAIKRFSNIVLNRIYHMFDTYAIKKADYIWNVSTRITSVRFSQGIKKDKNITVPNAPILRLMKRPSSRKKISHSLVLIANFTPAIDYDVIVNSVAKLSKKYPKMIVSFIGSGPREKEVVSMVKKLGLQSNFRFHGYIEHDKAMKIISQHQIGLALYANQMPWTEYGDSLKAREYLAMGLPVLISSFVSTADDVRDHRAGASITLDEDVLVSTIDKIFKSKDEYANMRVNANAMAKRYDLEAILDKHLKKLL